MSRRTHEVVRLGPLETTCYDVDEILPRGWQDSLLNLAMSASVARTLIPTSVTSREETPDVRIAVLTVGGRTVIREAAWLYHLYRNQFRDLASRAVGEYVTCADDPRYGVVLNVQRGSRMRYECHVDSNPLEGLLYVTTHEPGSGGELVVSRNPSAHSVNEIEVDSDVVYPLAGRLVFFDARDRPHYVRPLNDPCGVRVVVAMNFYTEDSTESDRPADLNRHLFGED
jgi:2OG-Fe(II) oxygenase superfamily